MKFEFNLQSKSASSEFSRKQDKMEITDFVLLERSIENKQTRFKGNHSAGGRAPSMSRNAFESELSNELILINKLISGAST